MRIQHNTTGWDRYSSPSSSRPQGKRVMERSKSRERVRLAQLMLSVLLFLGVFCGKNLLPEQSQPVMEQIQAAVSWDLDFKELSLQVSAVLQGEESVRSVFRTILAPGEEDTSGSTEGDAPTQRMELQGRPEWLS